MPRIQQRSLKYKVQRTIKENNLISPGEKIVVAVSGGADSICLLNVLLELRNKLGFELSACHYNHKLRAKEGDRDAEFVKKNCSDNSIEFIYGEAPKTNSYKNEEQAREARYRFFEKILNQGRGDKIATAHTANDSAETFLLRLVRGSGLNGLRSIPLQRKNFIRPLLSLSRDEIESYLKDKNLSHTIDNTNFDTKYSRNFIRHKIIPLLLTLNPKLISVLMKTSNLIEEDYELINEIAETNYKEIMISEKGEIILDHKKWLSLPLSLKRLVLRFAINRKNELTDITQKQISEVCHLLENNIGNKHKVLPHSLRVTLKSGKIIISKNNS